MTSHNAARGPCNPRAALPPASVLAERTALQAALASGEDDMADNMEVLQAIAGNFKKELALRCAPPPPRATHLHTCTQTYKKRPHKRIHIGKITHTHTHTRTHTHIHTPARLMMYDFVTTDVLTSMQMARGTIKSFPYLPDVRSGAACCARGAAQRAARGRAAPHQKQARAPHMVAPY